MPTCGPAPPRGRGWRRQSPARATPPPSQELAAAWRPWIETCIDAFGPDRAMFESNFPPDKGQCSYQVIFNAFKRIAAQYSETEKTALFSGTAARIYRLNMDEWRAR